MSVATELSKLNTNILNAYDVIEAKDGTMPQNKNTDNLATAISSIPAGTPQVTDSNILITEYTPSTGVIKGQNFGNSGKVYLLDRDTHTYNELTTSSYTDTQVTLSSPIDTTNIVGTTCFYVAPTGKDISNKQMVYGDIAVSGKGIIYLQEDMDNPTNIRKIYIPSNANLSDYIGGSMNNIQRNYTVKTPNGENYVLQDAVGFQFGSETDASYVYYGFDFSPRFNQPIFYPKNERGTFSQFLTGCYNFDCPIVFEETTYNVNIFPLNDLYNFNQPLDLSPIANTSIDGPIKNARVFNQKVNLGSKIKTLSYFLNGCRAYNQPLDLSDVTTINNSFLSECQSFNQPLDFSNVTTCGSMLYKCQSFNQPLDLSHITSLTGSPSNMEQFNSEVKLNSNITSIPNSFLSSCYCFNQSITIPSNVTSIGNSFLNSCRNFNQSLTIPSNVTSIGNDFLYGNETFNKPITFLSNSFTVGNNFMTNCLSYNQPLSTEKFTTIGNYFMNNCLNFCYSITLNATSIGKQFLQNCYNFTKLIVNSDITLPSSDTASLSVGSGQYTRPINQGVKIYGTYRQKIIDAYPNQTNYRNLINGGS